MARMRAAKPGDETRESTSSGPRNFKPPRGIAYEALVTFVWALVLAFLLRIFLFQPFHIPTSSMEPNLISGDYIITTKYAYGYGAHSASPFVLPLGEGRLFGRAPTRGDVAVFRDEETSVNVVKRIIGFEGDHIQMRGGRLYINDEAVTTIAIADATSLDAFGNPQNIDLLQEQLASGARYTVYDQVIDDRYDDTHGVVVPQGHYFVLGDNRDSSADSRVPSSEGGVGFVADSTLIARAEFILLSVTDDFSIYKPWTWAMMRKSRFFKDIP